ncbi:MAG: hypothetical protein ACR2QK_00045 [Acidimicrobiales bacterium]
MSNPASGAALALRTPDTDLANIQKSARRWRDSLTALLGAAAAAGILGLPAELASSSGGAGPVALGAATVVGVLLTFAIAHAVAAAEPRFRVRFSDTAVERAIDRAMILLDRAQVLSYVAVAVTAGATLLLLSAPAFGPSSDKVNLLITTTAGEVLCGPTVSGEAGEISIVGIEALPAAARADLVPGCETEGNDPAGDTSLVVASSLAVGGTVAIIAWFVVGRPRAGRNVISAHQPDSVRFYGATVLVALTVSAALLAWSFLADNWQSDQFFTVFTAGAAVAGAIAGALISALYSGWRVMNPDKQIERIRPPST